MELLGFDDIMDEINKLFRTKLCPNTMGQIVTDAMVYPPDKGGPSYQLYKEVSSFFLPHYLSQPTICT